MRVASQSGANGYPPYNIEKAGNDAYRIVMAVAGFAEAELNVTQKENELLVTGQTAQNGQDDKAVARVVVVESKGQHLAGNPDTEYKRKIADCFEKIGKSVSWQQLGGAIMLKL